MSIYALYPHCQRQKRGRTAVFGLNFCLIWTELDVTLKQINLSTHNRKAKRNEAVRVFGHSNIY